MRQIFIGLFILALLGGLAAKVMNDSKDQTSYVGHFLKAVGFKQKEKMQRAQIDKIVRQFALQKDKMKDYLSLQRDSLTSSQVLMGSLSQLIQERLEGNSNIDLLRLKDLMQRHQDKSALLIEHGKQIAEFNDIQLKVNQKMAEEADRAAFISNSDRLRFIDNIQASLEQQQILMEQQRIGAEELQDTTQQILEKVNQMQSDVIFKQNNEVMQKLQSISEKTKFTLDKAQEQKRKLEENNQKNLDTLNDMKERIERMQQKALDSVVQSRKNAPDQARFLNDRLRDKLDRMQDQRIK